jgi:hypothetical protein
MDKRQARPTEYKGVVYRSKCEAMFARYLELDLADAVDEACELSRYGGPFFTGVTSSGGWGFVYEPPKPTVGRWVFDFLAWQMSYSHEICAPVFKLTWIEYKPSNATETYVNEFQQRCKKAFTEDFFANGIPVGYEVEAHLYCGSVFNSDRMFVRCVPAVGGSVLIREQFDWLEIYVEEIKSTRFDLINA